MLKQEFNTTAYDKLDEFVYGIAKKPVALKNGMVIGGGTIYPELNFTLPTMLVTKDSWPEVIRIYKEIAEGFCDRARELGTPGFVAEIETVPDMTFNPEWCIEVCKTVVDIIKEHSAKYGIKGAVRITPNDNREGLKEHVYKDKNWNDTLKAFVGSGKAGADFFSIESCGSKEIHDDAMMYCNLPQALFSLGVVGARDMEKLWTEIVRIADETGAIPAGDTACGFANTAMVLAEGKYIPRVFAAADRVMAAVRSLIAVECGAKGPDKDCGYEGPYEKAIAGIPISMEGKTAAVAHLSSVGNISCALADLWSNESVQQIKLLSGYAPVASFEMLNYDCRLLNTARKKSEATALLLRDLLVESDAALDPHAYILRPDVILDIAKAIVKEKGHYLRTRRAGICALLKMKEGVQKGQLQVDEKEKGWLDTLLKQLEATPEDEAKFTAEIIDDCENFKPENYDFKK
ncbi:MAG: methanol--corrinoid methyltransferase [Peptococcaceae bacterium]|jgi:methanol--5-hydroxybenzimidazolylcobamide Co-methyltransferase|nr:methanol--corrinoid methyltransferase [Peptococcaceae bacterium]